MNMEVSLLSAILHSSQTCGQFGITGRPTRLNLLQRSFEGDHAFVFTIVYGIQFVGREFCNAVDRHHSNRDRKVSGCITSKS